MSHLPPEKGSSYWGSPAQPYWFRGVNPSADLVLLRDGARGKEVLLVHRAPTAPAEAGKWALPGGFMESDAARGHPWKPGRETARQGAVRETREETSLDVSAWIERLRCVGIFEGDGRDPRDNAEAWGKNVSYVLDIGSHPLPEPAVQEETDGVEWVPLALLSGRELGFDHAAIIARGVAVASGFLPACDDRGELFKGLAFRRSGPLPGDEGRQPVRER